MNRMTLGRPPIQSRSRLTGAAAIYDAATDLGANRPNLLATGRNRPEPVTGRRYVATARFNAARASSRVESSVGSGELASFMISGISVQPSTAASQPASFIRA